MPGKVTASSRPNIHVLFFFFISLQRLTLLLELRLLFACKRKDLRWKLVIDL